MYICYIIASIVTFIIIDKKYPLDGEEVKNWITNYERHCEKFDRTYGLQNACLNGCAYTTAPFMAYISFINRHKIKYIWNKNNQIHDSLNLFISN